MPINLKLAFGKQYGTAEAICVWCAGGDRINRLLNQIGVIAIAGVVL